MDSSVQLAGTRFSDAGGRDGGAWGIVAQRISGCGRAGAATLQISELGVDGFDKVWASVETVRIELYVCTNWLFGAMLLGSGLRRTKWLLLL